MVRQHDPARTDPDRLRGPRDMPDHHGGGGTRDARHVVVLGQPVAAIARALGGARQVDGVGKGLGRRMALGHRRQVEKRIMLHLESPFPPDLGAGTRSAKGNPAHAPA